MKPRRVTQIRKNLGLTQIEFASLVNAHHMTVSRWERGTLKVNIYTEKIMEHLENGFYSWPGRNEITGSDMLLTAGPIETFCHLIYWSKC